MWDSLTYLQSGFELVSSMAASSPQSATSQKKVSIEMMNLEGLTTGIRVAMFPYAREPKIKLEEFAINLDLPYKLFQVNLKSVTRYLGGEGRQNFVIVKRMARIMLDLFPPIPKEEDKEIESITKIYFAIIAGLEHIDKTFFSEQSNTEKIPDPEKFDFDFQSKKHTEITDLMAGEAVKKTINLFRYCCKNKIEPKKDLTPLQIEVRKGYTKLVIDQLANSLQLIKETQGETPIAANWLCEHQFYALDRLVLDRIAYYERTLPKMSTLVPAKGEKALYGSTQSQGSKRNSKRDSLPDLSGSRTADLSSPFENKEEIKEQANEPSGKSEQSYESENKY